MTKTYQGNTPELYELFISGKQLQYQQTPWSEWRDIPIWNSKPNDIYRVGNSSYIFRVKPKDVITIGVHALQSHGGINQGWNILPKKF